MKNRPGSKRKPYICKKCGRTEKENDDWRVYDDGMVLCYHCFRKGVDKHNKETLDTFFSRL